MLHNKIATGKIPVAITMRDFRRTYSTMLVLIMTEYELDLKPLI